jgi:hypothetical protein
MSTTALIKNNAKEFTLKPKQDHVWVTVGNISVYIKRTDEGVVVDLFKLGHEDQDCITSTYAFFNE